METYLLTSESVTEGHPPSVMDMSFANQALASEYLTKNHLHLGKSVHVLPKEVDKQIASLKINSMNMNFDTLKEKQINYFNSWELGTGSSQENL